MEARFNEPLYNKVLGITNDMLQPGHSYSKMYRTEPRYNEILVISSTIQKRKHKMYPDITDKCQHATANHYLRLSFFDLLPSPPDGGRREAKSWPGISSLLTFRRVVGNFQGIPNLKIWSNSPWETKLFKVATACNKQGWSNLFMIVSFLLM